ncbi:hypothetical protein F4678DRAFT_434254 [Xylaria arbuscula]|nr:hypothetical protein F4678DRAFT_434254 [Xylaria arbuscula]
MTKVLLTGGSGFIAMHILDLLIQRGYEVVTTVRTEEKASSIRKAHPNANISFVIVPDIAQSGAFNEAVKIPGLDVVLHTASPFHFNFTDAKTEILDPAITGTTSILKAIKEHAPSVKRVVVTSSFVAILSEAGLKDPNKIFTEDDWNPVTYNEGAESGDKGTAYRASKTLAERAAWSFMEEEKPSFDLVTICPPLVFGPVAPGAGPVNTSNSRFMELIQGKWRYEILPSIGVNVFVHVRDVAFAHVAAMERPEAGGQRFFCASGNFCNRDIATAARAHFPELLEVLPSEDAPGGGYGAVIPGFSNARATEVLGIKWTGIEKTAVDTIQSLLVNAGEVSI